MKRFTERQYEELIGALSEAGPAQRVTALMSRREHSGRIRLCLGALLVWLICYSAAWAAEEWPRPQLVPLPMQVE